MFDLIPDAHVLSTAPSRALFLFGMVAQSEDPPHQRHPPPHQAPASGADLLGDSRVPRARRARRRPLYEHKGEPTSLAVFKPY